MRYADLHLHTVYSDGENLPALNVRECAWLGIELIAITDHDSTRGYMEAEKEAGKWGMTVLSGVEISTPDYHILGYGFDMGDRDLQELLEYSRRCQEEIVRTRIGLLREQGVPITFEKVEHHFPEARLGKRNIGITLLRDSECRRHVGNMAVGELINLYIGKGTPAGEAGQHAEVSPREAVEAIHNAGGIAVIAHPFKDIKRMEELEYLLNIGLDGIEIQPNYGDKNKPFEAYAQMNNMIITYGSDFHGAAMPSRPLLGKALNLVGNFWENIEEK